MVIELVTGVISCSVVSEVAVYVVVTSGLLGDVSSSLITELIRVEVVVSTKSFIVVYSMMSVLELCDIGSAVVSGLFSNVVVALLTMIDVMILVDVSAVTVLVFVVLVD